MTSRGRLKKGDIVILSCSDQLNTVMVESQENADVYIFVENGTLAIFLEKKKVKSKEICFSRAIVMTQGFVGWVYDDEIARLR